MVPAPKRVPGRAPGPFSCPTAAVLLSQDGVTVATAHRVLATLRSALNAAVREKLIGDNPARYLKLPPARRPHAVVWTPRRVKEWKRTGQRPAVAVWTPVQTAQFLD